MMRLINEDDVLEIVERVTNEAVERRQPKYLIQPKIVCEIAGLPTIEAEPVKHGRWEEKHYMKMKWIPSRFDDVSPEDVDIEPMVELKCSKCHLWSVDFRNHIELKYCPNCGARMDGDNDD